MRSLQVELPEKLAEQLDALVRGGWFQSEGEVVRAALVEFVRRYRFELLEKHQRQDIAWALRQKGKGSTSSLG